MINTDKLKMSRKAYVVIQCANIMVDTDDPKELEVMFEVANKRLRDIYIMKKAGFKDEREKVL